jgi:hypothetical protein
MQNKHQLEWAKWILSDPDASLPSEVKLAQAIIADAEAAVEGGSSKTPLEITEVDVKQ